MGFFDFLRRKNKIVIDFDISTEPVFVYPTNKIKLPMQAVVPKDCVLFLTDGDKILDSFAEGEHELSLANLPKCDKRFKLSKPNKDGKFQKYFFCDVYIVNKILFKYKPFKCYRKAEIFDKNVGEFKVSISGGYAFQITNPQKFLQNLLCEYNHLRNKEAEKILSGYVELAHTQTHTLLQLLGRNIRTPMQYQRNGQSATQRSNTVKIQIMKELAISLIFWV